MSSLLDLIESNPWSRVPRSRYHTLDTARMVIFNRLRHNTSYKEEAKSYKKILAARAKISEEQARRDRVLNRERSRKIKNRKTNKKSHGGPKAPRSIGGPPRAPTKVETKSTDSSLYTTPLTSQNPFGTTKEIPRSPEMPPATQTPPKIKKVIQKLYEKKRI